MPEEDAFATLVHIMQSYDMRNLYKPLMAQLGLVMYQFECMIKVNKWIKLCKILEVVVI
jgi:ecotropic viral integration site 5 protein